MDIYTKTRIESWKSNCIDSTLKEELYNLNDSELEDAFFKELEFGTGGLRGIIGVGSNRMNIYSVAKASQGLSNYLKKTYNSPMVAIGCDTRINSKLFSKVAAEVFAFNNVKVYIYKEEFPVPMLSYATRVLNCHAGVMITASHNPAKYNGYKVYKEDGCQITDEIAGSIQKEIKETDEFKVQRSDFNEALSKGLISYIDDGIYDKYVDNIKKTSYLFNEKIAKDLSIVYTPLNGTGIKPVFRVLKELGYTGVKVVKEQECHDGNFPTCPFPNPELKEAFNLAIEYAKKNNADIILATDPDCDRLGVAIKDKDDYRILSGNEVGVLLFDYISSSLIRNNKLPVNPVLIKTIVTTDLALEIANKKHIKTINTLTGFKYIGEQIGLLEEKGEIDRFIFGFEESNGCLSHSQVRDKDGVNAAVLVCEMFSYYKTQGESLLDKLEEIYKEYGRYTNTLVSKEYPGLEGFKEIKRIMSDLRNGSSLEFEGKKIIKKIDYLEGIDGLPKADVIKLFFFDSTVVIRPSGTEPKIKMYYSTKSQI